MSDADVKKLSEFFAEEPRAGIGGESERHWGLFTTQKTPLVKVDIELSRN